ncbi:60S ribosomal subunit assembly or modification protein [Diatrype stigma]|uniref:60S ribosomal subunit assembly or modification protein n=1 Tax=Diatrype stigma TaxID=117547 RepID=A0AAN9URF7_9PEZI
MAAPHRPQDDDIDDMPETLDAEDALEEYDEAAEGGMDLDDEDEDREEIILQNDSIAYFDAHKGSVFAIAQHPTIPSLIATGGGEGDEDDAPGKGYVFDTSAVAGRPVLPASYHSDPGAAQQLQQARSTELTPLFAIDGHTDSVNALAFTLPRGEYLVSGGLDGRLRTYQVSVDARNKPTLAFVAEAQEVPEINWVAACPAPQYANAIAIGGSDGSVWIYTIDGADPAGNPLQIVQTYFLHAPAPCTAGAWSPDGQLLATVAEDGSLHVWDVWGAAAAAGISNDNGQTVVSLTDADSRFAVEGGLYSVAVDPRGGAFVAVGGAGGAIKIVGLPRLSGDKSNAQQQAPQNSRQTKAKAKGASGTGSQAGVILADLAVQRDSVETLAFSPHQPLLAAGSVDGSVAVYDASRGFAARKLNEGAHDEYSVVKVEFVPDAGDGWLLTSCGMDGAVKRWDVRSHQVSGAARPTGVVKADPARLVKEWRGHRGEGEGGGVLGFVQGATGERVVTAGDDGLALVFEA